MSNVTVIGAGLAGLQTSLHLARYGVPVTLVDRKSEVGEGVHTTGIFVRRTLDEFDFPAHLLSAPIRDITLYGPTRGQISIDSPNDEFRVGRMAGLYRHYLNEAQQAGVKLLLGHRFLGIDGTGPHYEVTLESSSGTQSHSTDMLIGADGAKSRVAQATGLSQNNRWIIGLEEVYESTGVAAPRFHLFLNAELSPGYLAWAVDDGEEVHIGVGGFVPNYHPPTALRLFQMRAREVVQIGNWIERRGGRIPVGGVLPDISRPGALLVGDAAGAVSPLTAGGLDPCMRLSRLAADVAIGYLNTEGSHALTRYQGSDFRTAFRTRLALRWALEAVRSNRVFDLGMSLARVPGVSRLAEEVFFGRGSFPDRPLRYIGGHLSTASE